MLITSYHAVCGKHVSPLFKVINYINFNCPAQELPFYKA